MLNFLLFVLCYTCTAYKYPSIYDWPAWNAWKAMSRSHIAEKNDDYFFLEIWNLIIVTFSAILRLSRDFQVASGRGNRSTQRKPPPNINAPAGIRSRAVVKMMMNKITKFKTLIISVQNHCNYIQNVQSRVFSNMQWYSTTLVMGLALMAVWSKAWPLTACWSHYCLCSNPGWCMWEMTRG